MVVSQAESIDMWRSWAFTPQCHYLEDILFFCGDTLGLRVQYKGKTKLGARYVGRLNTLGVFIELCGLVEVPLPVRFETNASGDLIAMPLLVAELTLPSDGISQTQRVQCADSSRVNIHRGDPSSEPVEC